MAVTLRERIRALLDSADEDEAAGEDDLDEGDEAAADEEEADAEGELDEEEADEESEGGVEDETPGGADAEEDDAEDEDLRAVIRDQAAMIETYRNRLAEAGLLDEAEEVAAGDEAEDVEDEDVVEAFERDYAERQARLAEIGD